MDDPDAHIGSRFDDFLDDEGMRKDIEVAVRKRLARRLPKVGRPQKASDAQIWEVIDKPWREACKLLGLSRSRYLMRRKVLLDRARAAEAVQPKETNA